TDLNALDETVKAFSRVDLTGCIITKLDEASAIGAPMSAAIRHHLPVAYVGVGQRVPEDLQPARAHRLISRALNSGAGTQKAEELEPDVLAAKLRGARAAFTTG
ncbi:MAG TPA: flagellar biosynthesis protein FlhF, partial [Gammaproteobacteria bacterium]|nr:flagellar biosynthesis protein FlhF [Gammaproteobacteria bacterium]